MKSESSSLGVANARVFFFFSFFPPTFFISFSFPYEANKCFPFITRGLEALTRMLFFKFAIIIIGLCVTIEARKRN